jgi:microcystin-dependent protein
MPYNITLSNGSDLITGGLLDNTLDTSNSSLSLVGKNYKSYGLFVNQNFVRLMENFANSSAPTAPLPGQIWFNPTTKLLNLNISATKGTASAIWKTVAGLTLSATTPTNPYQNELWYDSTNGQLYIYTGTAWRLIGPANKLSTGNSGVIPDTVTDAPPSTTYVILKFVIDDVLVAIWSKDGPFLSDVPGFSTIKKGLNLHSTLGHTFWGNSEVANSLYVNGAITSGNLFVRNDLSGSINGSLILTNDNGITFGAANDFVGNVSSGTVILQNRTNNKDFILSLKSSGNQTPFFRGNYLTGLPEAYDNPIGSSPALSLATKNYVDILAGSVNGTANFFGNITPSSNNIFTVGNVTNKWSNIFSVTASIDNLISSQSAIINANISQIYLGSDIVPTANISSNLGSVGMRFNTLNSNSASLTGSLNVGLATTIGGNLSVAGSASLGVNLNVVGTVTLQATTTSTSSATGALIVSGGAGIAGNVNVAGQIVTPTMPAGTSNTAVATTAFVINNSVPTGALLMWSTGSVPSGWLLCDGAAVSRTTYSTLFGVIGTTFGSGDGSTTFNLPDYQNRAPFGAGGLYALGTTGGSKDAVVVSHSHTATSTSTSTVTDPGHRHQVGTGNRDSVGSLLSTLVSGSGTNTSLANTGISVATSTSTTVNSTGSSGTDANMPPYLAINFIIKT